VHGSESSTAPSSEAERAARAIGLGVVLGLLLAMFARRR
jgi:hypothetical protein